MKYVVLIQLLACGSASNVAVVGVANPTDALKLYRSSVVALGDVFSMDSVEVGKESHVTCAGGGTAKVVATDEGAVFTIELTADKCEKKNDYRLAGTQKNGDSHHQRSRHDYQTHRKQRDDGHRGICFLRFCRAERRSRAALVQHHVFGNGRQSQRQHWRIRHGPAVSGTLVVNGTSYVPTPSDF